MERLAEQLTCYLLKQHAIRAEETEVYRFGFQMGLEVLTFHAAGLIMAAILHQMPEYILFTLVFTLIRSYAGGLHLATFGRCFCASLTVACAVLLLGKTFTLPLLEGLAAVLGLLLALFIMKPVDHKNRPVDAEEQRFFRGRLCGVLVGIGCTALVLFLLKLDHFLTVIMLTLVAAVVSMAAGRWGCGE